MAHGRRIRSVPGDTTRPITDRTKESLFNIIGGDIDGATFLDLFAGTGSVGLEALSRGASFVRFVDKASAAVKTIYTNLEITGLANQPNQEKSDVLQMDAFQLLERTPDRHFDYLYIAPPQYKELWQRALSSVDMKRGWLSQDAWVIVQINPIEYQKLELTQLVEFDQRKYGSTLLVFFRVK